MLFDKELKRLDFDFSGEAPLVVARGGFSGLFADSSYAAYSLAVMTSLPNVHLWCDVQLTKDAAGICLPDLKLNNATDIADVFQKGQKEYVVNGVLTKGWFPVDFTLNDLSTVYCIHKILSSLSCFHCSSPYCVADVEFLPILFLGLRATENNFDFVFCPMKFKDT